MADTELTELEVIEMINRFNSDDTFSELREMYSSKSFPEILSVGRTEMSHSAFISWLLKPNESHGLGVLPLICFLKILVRRDIEQGRNRHSSNNYSTEDISTACITEGIILKDIEITVERPTSDIIEKGSGRMDIIIKGKILWDGNEKRIHIIIENKVYSKEQNNQTKVYFDKITKNKNNDISDIFLFVYLTPNNDNNNFKWPECTCKEYIQISYQDLMYEVLDPLMHKDIPQRTRFIVQEYIRCLSVPTLDDTKSNNKTIAMSEKTQVLLKDFWNKNQSLLTAIIEALKDDPDIGESASNMLAAMTNKMCCEFDNETIVGRASIVRKIILYLLDNVTQDINDINRNIQIGKSPLLLEGNPNGNTAYQPLNRDNLYFYYQWRTDKKVKDLVEKVKENYNNSLPDIHFLDSTSKSN